MRPGRGTCSGKRRILIDIIDKYWDELVGDFAHILHWNAEDWLHCRLYGGDSSQFTWSRFLIGAVYCTNEHGSALFDASLGDPELVEDIYQQLVKDQSAKIKRPEAEYHPSRRGYTREVEATLDVVDNLIALRAERGKWKGASTRFAERPIFPSTAAQARMTNRSRSIRDEKIAASQARWRKKNGLG